MGTVRHADKVTALSPSEGIAGSAVVDGIKLTVAGIDIGKHTAAGIE